MSGIYAVTSNAFATAGFNWLTGTFGAMLLGPGYTPDYLADHYLSDVPGVAQLLSAPVPLTGLSIGPTGFCKADNLSWIALATTAAVEAVLIVQNVGPWQLVCLIDQGAGFGQQANTEPANLLFSSQGIFRP